MTDSLQYHRHMDAIVREDVKYLRTKDTQYNASWKKRSGPGAFFTIARPWDRLENISRMSGYDIFSIIEDEGLHGPDGSLIACVRDMRRYLLLVEAEMTERLIQRNADSEKEFTHAPKRYPPGTPENGGHHEKQFGSGDNGGGVGMATAGCDPNLGGRGGGGGVSPHGIEISRVVIGETRAPQYLYSADGVQDEEDKLKGFSYMQMKLGSTTYWILDRTKLNVDERENLPQLQTEMNHKEYELSPLWYRPLYVWLPSANKWVIDVGYREHWGKRV